MSKQIELKPCPFCGEPVELVSNEEDGDIIICTDCGFFMNISSYESPKAAFDSWNHRPSQWISVDDEMPDSGVEVLIADDLDNVNIGFYDDDSHDAGWVIISGAKRFVPISESHITHWMPFPEPPEKEQK